MSQSDEMRARLGVLSGLFVQYDPDAVIVKRGTLAELLTMGEMLLARGEALAAALEVLDRVTGNVALQTWQFAVHPEEARRDWDAAVTQARAALAAWRGNSL